ncbi:MAG: glycosyltransferase family 4 protein [Acidimicrobiales bacterium]
MTSVGIDLLWLVPGEVGGSEQSTVATVRGLLERVDDELDLQLFVLPGLAQAHPDLVASTSSAVAPFDGSSRARRVLEQSRWLGPRTAALDVVHHAGGTVPPGGRRGRGPGIVLTLHDLQPLEASATHTRWKRAYLHHAVPRAVRRSARIAVPSEFVRTTVLERFPVAPERVVAIPHAVPLRPSSVPRDVLVERYRLTAPVVLYPAITYPHKEHATLLSAFERVLARHPDATLVLPGGVGGSEGEVRAQIDGSEPLRAHVRRLGRIPEADVAGLLELADVVAVPSRYEGFGLPALEGMAAGTAVVAADATSLPEVVGDAGRLVPVGQPEAWADAIGALLADPHERDRLARAGHARAARYTAEANAGAFARLYREVAAEA